MKKFLCIMLIFASCFTAAFAEEDYPFLDGMTLEQLQSLSDEIDVRISKEKAAVAAANPEKLGAWKMDYYVDEFNIPTDKNYIFMYGVDGTFSNSATTNSELEAAIVVDKDKIAFTLVEYGRYPVKGSFKKITYSITVLDTDGNKTNMSATLQKNDDKIYIDQKYKVKMLELLNKNSTLIFSIQDKKYGSSYVFTLEDTSFFENAYSALN